MQEITNHGMYGFASAPRDRVTEIRDDGVHTSRRVRHHHLCVAPAPTFCYSISEGTEQNNRAKKMDNGKCRGLLQYSRVQSAVHPHEDGTYSVANKARI